MDDVILLLYSEIKVRVRTSDDALPSGKGGDAYGYYGSFNIAVSTFCIVIIHR